MFELLVIERKRKLFSPSSITISGKLSDHYEFVTRGTSKIINKDGVSICLYNSLLNYTFSQKDIKPKLLSAPSLIEFIIPSIGLLSITEVNAKYRSLTFEVFLDGNLLGNISLCNLSFIPWLETYSVSCSGEAPEQDHVDVLIFSLFVVFCEKSTYVGT